MTLKDAGNYITKLSKAEHEAPEWLAAAQALGAALGRRARRTDHACADWDDEGLERRHARSGDATAPILPSMTGGAILCPGDTGKKLSQSVYYFASGCRIRTDISSLVKAGVLPLDEP